jgi:hypothetical protein
MSTVDLIYNIQERIIASRQYMLEYDLLGRATSDVRRDAGRVALDVSRKEAVLNMAPILIDDEMLQLVHAAAATLPGGTVWTHEMMMFPAGLITAHRPLMHLSQERDIVVAQWASDAAVDACVYINWAPLVRRFPGAPSHILWPFLLGHIGNGSRMDEGLDLVSNTDVSAREDHNKFGKFLMALWLLMSQRIAVKEAREAPRAVRRRFIRDHDAEPPGTIMIRLRRPSLDNGHEAASSPVNWTHRWMVDGFWRNQYHPSTGQHIPTWIAPYIKGPGDKPIVLKDRMYTFVR